MLRKGRDKQQRKLTKHEQRNFRSCPREGPKGALPGRNATSQEQPIYTEDREAGPKMLGRIWMRELYAGMLPSEVKL